MHTVRFPVAAVGGAILCAALFIALASLVGVEFHVTRLVTTPFPDFTPQIKDTPVETKRNPKVARPRPTNVVVEPKGFGRPTGGGIDIAPTPYVPPVVAVGGGRGLPMGTDRDVLPLVRVPPEYPVRARKDSIEGWVQVRFSVTPTGSVRDPVVVAAEPANVFERAALEALMRWRYNPRVENGVAVERVGLQAVIRFELED